MIVDGKAIANDILAKTMERAAKLSRLPLVVAIRGNDSKATESYLAIKTRRAADAGCRFEVRAYEELYSDADAVIVQLPLAPGLDTEGTLNAIPVEKDADVLSAAARERFEEGVEGALLPPVVAAIREIFVRYEVSPRWKQVVVVGEGRLVGAPAATWLKQQGALVHTLTKSSGDLSILKGADIIISGAGSPGLIKPEMIREGVVLIDAATSESNGELKGDADPACADKCSVFTPVPGGVGPIAVACLFANAVTLAERLK